MTSIKGCNSATNFLKMTLYNHNLDLINVNVDTKFGLILFIHCQDIEQNEILTSIKGRDSVANLSMIMCIQNMRNLTLYNPNLDIMYVNE